VRTPSHESGGDGSFEEARPEKPLAICVPRNSAVPY
jgi:hypothetical protein